MVETNNRSNNLVETMALLLDEQDQFREAGNIEDAIRLENAADKYFGPKGIFRKATGEE